MRLGVFDSGMGGLTVLAELVRRWPGVHFLYLGDTARVPYGTKGAETIRQYAQEAATFLNQFYLDGLVVACNSASAVAIDALRETHPQMQIFGVIEPGARMAISKSVTKKVAVLGTERTIRSDAYKKRLQTVDPRVQVVQIACPLFVPLVEEGITQGDIAETVARHYLEQLNALPESVDTVILGCTHYPLLRDTIAKTLPAGAQIVDSAAAVADEIALTLPSIGDFSQSPMNIQVFTTDGPETFHLRATRFVEFDLPVPQQVTIAP